MYQKCPVIQVTHTCTCYTIKQWAPLAALVIAYVQQRASAQDCVLIVVITAV